MEWRDPLDHVLLRDTEICFHLPEAAAGCQRWREPQISLCRAPQSMEMKRITIATHFRFCNCKPEVGCNHWLSPHFGRSYLVSGRKSLHPSNAAQFRESHCSNPTPCPLRGQRPRPAGRASWCPSLRSTVLYAISQKKKFLFGEISGTGNYIWIFTSMKMIFHALLLQKHEGSDL